MHSPVFERIIIRRSNIPCHSAYFLSSLSSFLVKPVSDSVLATLKSRRSRN